MTLNREPQRLDPVPLDWLVIANGARARIFERNDGNGALREIADPVHPASREKESVLGRDRPGRVRKGAVTTAFEPRTAPRVREQMQFAHELAAMLESAAIARRMPGFVLMASNPFLGELRTALGPAARAALRISIALDLTGFRHADLERRVSEALDDHPRSVADARS